MGKTQSRLARAAVLLFLLGLGLYLGPAVCGRILQRQQAALTTDFYATHPGLQAAVTTEPESTPTEPTPTEAPLPYAALREAAEAYNQTLRDTNQTGFNGPAAYEAPALTLSDYAFPGEVFAVVEIPSLALTMPVYLGANTANLALGAAHLGQTSLPLGGPGTNCVIAGHRGWRGAEYFRSLPQLRPGDIVTITNPWETLTYQVVETRDIAASDSDAVRIRPGEDLLTLLTCDYGSGVKYRFLAICQRVTDEAGHQARPLTMTILGG